MPTKKLNGKKSVKQYVDGFVIPISKKNVPAYRRMAQKAGKVWMEYGALEFRECVGDDLNTKMPAHFPGMLKLKSNETVLFSWIVYKSKAQRDIINEKVIKDPRLAKMMDPKTMPFDMKQMIFGGFKTIVNM